jgi:osmotically-inducible protein OsmY
MRNGMLAVAFVLALAVAYASSQQPTVTSTTHVNSADSALQSKVQRALATDAAFKNVNASVRDGVVDLSGTVTSQPDQKRAKDVASKVAGVKSVNEHLSIGEAAAATAPSNSVVPQTAQSETSNNTAGSIAGNSGAIGSTTGDTQPTKTTASSSGLGLTPDVDSNTLRSQIDSALKSDPTLSGAQVSVDVNDTQITLSGSVPSGKEKQTAVRIAQSYAGNRRVNDKVTLAGKQAPPNSQNPNAMGTNPK